MLVTRKKSSANNATAFAILPILLGFLVLIGWFTHKITFIQVSPTFMPMQYYTALSFLIIGSGLIYLLYSKPNISLVLGVMIIGFGVSTVSVSLWFSLLPGTNSYAQIFVLIFSTVLAIVLGICLHLHRQAYQSSMALESSNKLLAEEILNSTAINNQLRVTKTRMERAFEILSDAVLTGDLINRKITACNQSTTDIFGYEKDELIGQSFSKLHIDEAAFQAIGEKLHLALTANGIGKFNQIMRRKDGSQFPSEITVTDNKDTFGELTEFVVVIRDVTAQTKTDENLRVALVDAEMANQAKSEFLATISHELRTPLNAILGFSDILHNQYFGPPGAGKYREYAKNINSSGEHLLELINEVLDISSIKAGEMVLNIIEFEAHIAIEECLDIIAEKGREKNIALSSHIPKNLPLLRADKRAVRQILLNILSNSLKFTPDGGKVEVTAIEVDNVITFKVSDTGIGIAAELLPDLMTPFTRVEQDPYKAVEGWGLGLSIANSLVNLHSGEIDIESTVDEGTTVTFTLPNITA